MSNWQSSAATSTWEEWFKITGADGVDFHPICCSPNEQILQSNTKEEFLSGKVESYPKSGYSFYKMIGGKKYYISLKEAQEKHKLNVEAEVDYLRYEGILELTEKEYEEFKKNPKSYLLNHYDPWDNWKFVVDDYSIEDIGEINSINYEEVE